MSLPASVVTQQMTQSSVFLVVGVLKLGTMKRPVGCYSFRYGAKIRAPHALVMTFLFRSGR